jgi:alpha-glucosidase
VPDAPDGTTSIHNATANTPGILDFLHEFKREVMAGTDAFTVGEANGVTANDFPAWVGADGVFDMVFEFTHMLVPQSGAQDWYVQGDWKLTDLKDVFAASQKATAENGWYPIYLENHDQPRSMPHFMPNASDEKAAAKVLAIALHS